MAIFQDMRKSRPRMEVEDAPLLKTLPQGSRQTPLSLDHKGHRARLRARFLAAGGDALADHELIEMTLFMALSRRDTKPVARALLERFGSYANVVCAPVADLLAVEGLSEASVAAIKLVQEAAQRLVRAEVLNHPVLDNWERLMAYLQVVLGREKTEQFRVLYLDSRNRLLADVPQTKGTVNHTPVYPREVIKRALELHAVAFILVHNHPSGDPSPSEEDIQMTSKIKRAANALSLVLHDHIIIGNGEWLSLRKIGLL